LGEKGLKGPEKGPKRWKEEGLAALPLSTPLTSRRQSSLANARQDTVARDRKVQILVAI